MGWTYSTGWETRQTLVNHLTRTETNDTRTRTCITSCVRGNVLWSVWEIIYPDKPAKRYIGCDLLQNGGHNRGWGYKDMCESVHPYYYSCPLKYLELVPEVANQEWRDKVTKYHATRKIPLRKGLIVGLKECVVPALMVEQVTPKLVGTSRDGRRFAFKRGNMSGEVFETWPSTI
jgi:hypothetical protein